MRIIIDDDTYDLPDSLPIKKFIEVGIPNVHYNNDGTLHTEDIESYIEYMLKLFKSLGMTDIEDLDSQTFMELMQDEKLLTWMTGLFEGGSKKKLTITL